MWVAIALSLAAPTAIAQTPAPAATADPSGQDRAARFPGMDQSVNVDLANKAGIPPRKPYINVEEWGDLWNLMLLFGGGVCGFVIGRWWDQIWGRRRPA